MSTVPIHTAKTHLSRLIERACAGEDVIIARGDVPVVRLVPVDAPAPARRPNTLKGIITFNEAFWDPLPEDELDAWEGGSR